MTLPVCVACTTRTPAVGAICAGCYHHTNDALAELAERWGLLHAALLDPNSTIEQRVSGSREPPLPGGEALNLIGPANLHVAERQGWVLAWRSATDTTRPADGLCAATDEAIRTREDATTYPEQVRCGLKFGHLQRHREHPGPDAWTWPYRQSTWRREPVLTADGEQRSVPPGDQVGAVDPTEVLWSWTRDWCQHRHLRETGPNPDLSSIVGWLRARLDWACQHHPNPAAVGDFMGEVRTMVDTMRTVLAVRRYVQRYREPCPRCDLVALYREVDPQRGASAWVQCGSCGNLWRESEFARLSVILDGEARRVA